MIPLDDPRWTRFSGYGNPSAVPDLLRRLAGGDDEAAPDLYGALCHQGDASQAAMAAFPHLAAMGGAGAALDLLARVTTSLRLVPPARPTTRSSGRPSRPCPPR